MLSVLIAQKLTEKSSSHSRLICKHRLILAFIYHLDFVPQRPCNCEAQPSLILIFSGSLGMTNGMADQDEEMRQFKNCRRRQQQSQKFSDKIERCKRLRQRKKKPFIVCFLAGFFDKHYGPLTRSMSNWGICSLQTISERRKEGQNLVPSVVFAQKIRI